MVNGECGTGKELVARALHDYGRRRTGPFVAINMAAIPRELIESELFGHERGAFTGAHQPQPGPLRAGRTAARCSSTRSATCRPRRRPGCCACCRRASSPPSAAASRSAPMCASSPPPIATCARRSAQGQFREDLFYRLNVVPIRLPPLRERVEDIAAAGAALPRQGARGRGCRRKRSTRRRSTALRAASLARQRARAGEPDAPAGRALPAGDDQRRGRSRAELAEASGAAPGGAPPPRRQPEPLAPRSSGTSASSSPPAATACRCATSTTR